MGRDLVPGDLRADLGSGAALQPSVNDLGNRERSIVEHSPEQRAPAARRVSEAARAACRLVTFASATRTTPSTNAPRIAAVGCFP